MADDNPYQSPPREVPDAGEVRAIVRWALAFLAAFALFWMALLPCLVGVFLLQRWGTTPENLADANAPSLALLVARLYLAYWYVIPLATLCASFAFFSRFFRRHLRP